MTLGESSARDSDKPLDRRTAHRWAAERLAELRPELREAGTVLRRSRRRVRRARRAQRRARTEARLAATSVKELAKGSGVRTPPLLDGDVRSAADVLALGEKRLIEIRGIAQKSARTIMQRAREAERVQAADLRPPANPAEWTDADRVLVRALHAFSLVSTLIGLPDLTVLQHLRRLLRSLWWATSWLRWLFSGEDSKANTRARRATVQADYESQQTTAAMRDVQSGLQEAHTLFDRSLSDAELESQWRASSSELLALLDQFLAEDSTAEERQAAGFSLVREKLTPDLVQNIENLVLDQSLIQRHLRAYQDFGARFAIVGRRVLLGDDMGLGKTIQALAAIAHATSAENQQHHVVICPASLIDNWIREIDQTLTTVSGWAFHDQSRSAAYANWREHGGILVTTYWQTEHLLEQDLPPIGLVVIDEAHEVKNPDTKKARLARRLTARGTRALLMGGTLMENRAKELISLTDLMNPQRGRDMVRTFGDGSSAHYDPDRFRKALAEFYLRRNQHEVLAELPEIIATDELIDVGEDERLACKQALANRNLARAREALTIGGGPKSEKMCRLAEIIDECRTENQKVLVFSEFRDVLRSIRDTIGSDCDIIDGTVPKQHLPGIIQSFQDAPGFAALSVQIRVGGVGLNLQAASVVVLMEPQLKPSTEWQAVARAHRMGQTRRVMVYRLVAENSVDERIVELTQFKAELFDKLARRSILAERSLAASDRRIHETDLLAEEQRRFDPPAS